MRYLFLIFSLFIVNVQAADLNGYTAQYECISGGANCNVDVATIVAQSCDQTITTSTTPTGDWSALDASANDVICIENGDHSGRGTLTLSDNGTSGTRKVLRYYHASDAGDDPWDQSTANKAILANIIVDADYWIIHRLSFPGNTTNYRSPRVEVDASSSDTTNVIFNKILVEGNGFIDTTDTYYGYSQNGSAANGYSDLVIQNSVFRNGSYDTTGGYPRGEWIAVNLESGTNLWLVNSEIYNWTSHPVQLGEDGIPTRSGIVVENNDLYFTSAWYTGGGKGSTESLLSLKLKGTSGDHTQIIHNRMWGARVTDTAYCCNGEDGNALTWYNADGYVLFQNNIVMDSQTGINNISYNMSIIGNIFYDISRKDSGTVSYVWSSWDSEGLGIGTGSAQDYEYYLNTVVSTGEYTAPSFEYPDGDIRCNVFIDGGSQASGTTSGTAEADYNVFYGSTKFEHNAGSNSLDFTVPDWTASTIRASSDYVKVPCSGSCDASDGKIIKYTSSGTTGSVEPTWPSLGGTGTDGTADYVVVRGPFSFYRKLQTSPEQIFIPYVDMHTSATENTLCPSTMADRAGIGVDNTAADW